MFLPRLRERMVAGALPVRIRQKSARIILIILPMTSQGFAVGEPWEVLFTDFARGRWWSG